MVVAWRASPLQLCVVVDCVCTCVRTSEALVFGARGGDKDGGGGL